ncbi:MAG: hypothetical protein VYC40_06125 [Pseudomonadota bacterium]|nr:hypothetical protein [Pseudomonadota bacterium]
MFKRYVLFFQAMLKRLRETEVHKTEEKRAQSAGGCMRSHGICECEIEEIGSDKGAGS